MSMLTVEECDLLGDSKYRSYITQVEKALKSFEYTSEWADLISALGKLNKVLLSHLKYQVVPKKVTIGKRLAQCLHPALPSGVHLKALETYDIIFKCIGTQRLAQDLFIYSAGMFPLLSHAAMSVKPVLLTIYENHFVALGKRIKPGLNGLLLGLLPGLEEGAEFCERVNILLEDFCDGAEPEFFYTCLWECVQSCPSVRLPAFTFLISHFNKKQTMEDQLHMMGLDLDILVQSLCSSMQDTSVLVQRSVLDFLLLAFPMHNSQLTKEDVGRIVSAAVSVVLRRDMSLNRRLYNWLLGTTVSSANLHSIIPDSSRLHRSDSTSTNSEMDLVYFEQFSKEMLVQALKSKLTDFNNFDFQSGRRISMMRPFRILISLLDKPEIGPVILEHVILSVFQCLYRECKNTEPPDESKPTSKLKSSETPVDDTSELLKTANLLFNSLEPYFVWDFLGRMFQEACQRLHDTKRKCGSSSSQDSVITSNVPTIKELCLLSHFLLDIVSLETYIETQTEYLPDMLRQMLQSLQNHCEHISENDITHMLQLCATILSKVQPSMTAVVSPDTVSCDTADLTHSKTQQPQHDDSNKIVEASKRTANKWVIVTVAGSDKKADNESKTCDVTANSDIFSVQTKSAEIYHNKDCEKKNVDDNKNPTCEASLDTEPCKETEHKPEHVPHHLDSVSSSYTPTVMQSCVEIFKEFVHLFVSERILQSRTASCKCMESLLLGHEGLVSMDQDSVLDGVSLCSSETHMHQEFILNPISRISTDRLTDDSFEAFSHCCQLMVDFSSFPLFCSSSQEVIDMNFYTDEKEVLPSWVQDLLTCCCFVDSFPIQSAAMATILDLILLTQSVQTEAKSKNQSSSHGTVSVLIVPVLLPKNLQYINTNTLLYQAMAQELWRYLSAEFCQHHYRTVELLNILHQATPNSWVCEDVISSALVSENQTQRTEAFKKFTILWHLTRDMKTDHNPGQAARTFDRSMFVVLDSLKEEMSSTKTIAASWLTHVVQRSDISRVLQPLLLMLLHPDTARISVQHISVDEPKKVKLSETEEEEPEAKIYAISSDGGNIIYHVSPLGRKIPQTVAEDLKSVAMMVMNSKGSATTAPAHAKDDSELHFEKVNPDDVMLRINPFGSQSSLDKLIFDGYEFPRVSSMPDLRGAKRLDAKTCKKEGIFFDPPGETDTDDIFEEEPSSEDIVRQFLDDILEHVCQHTPQSGDTDCDGQKRTLNLTSRDSSVLGDHDLLNGIDRQGLEMDSQSGSETDIHVTSNPESSHPAGDIHALHMHILLYAQKYDYKRTLYALSTLKAMLLMCPRLMVTSMSTTSISSIRPPHMAKIQTLLARHRKSVYGKNFFGEISPDVFAGYRSNMIIDVLISLCLYYVRSYYPNLMMSKLSEEELLGNKEVHMMAAEILILILSELIGIMKDSGKNFCSYIEDLLVRCKLQKALLHCVLASVYNSRRKNGVNNNTKLTEAIIAFNEDGLDPQANNTFQIRLLNLLLVMIMMERQIEVIHGVKDTTNNASSDWERNKSSLGNVKYTANLPIVQQGMFITGILSALKQQHMCQMHCHWVAMVTSALPYMDKALPRVTLCIVSQLCRNLDMLSADIDSEKQMSLMHKVPPDHILTMLEGLMSICHYCLLDNVSFVAVGQPAPTLNQISTDMASAGQIITNLIHVFNPANNNRETSPQRDSSLISPILDARRALLSIMPRIVACMATLWHAVSRASQEQSRCTNWKGDSLTAEHVRVIRQQILEFLSPISVPHGINLLGAFAVAWNDRRKKTQGYSKKVTPLPCEDQLLLVDLVSSIRVLPTDTLIQTVKQVLKQPPAADLGKGSRVVSLEVNTLQFFLAYVERTPASQLVDSWPSLLSLLKESLQLGLVPPGQFLLLQILNEFIHRTPAMEEKKSQKDLQDIAQKLLESVAVIAGLSLEQTTWLRRNLAVKPGPQTYVGETEEGEATEENEAETKVAERRVAEPQLNTSADTKYSVQALTLLAELTAPLLDVVYGSDEKDKISPILSSILYNIFPYLRNHSLHNLPSYRACSQFLSSISGYQYTRKSWRKDALEMFLDTSFFQMDVRCVTYWHNVIDNLMTHDKTTFKDLIGRVAVTQSGSLSLFTSKEAEFEQRAHMIKRLSFAIFCSDPDQYQRNIPDIQERLAESLRLPQVPSVMAQVFLCFRVLLLRMSYQQLTSLWPTIITEMVHVFLQIEQELSTETDEFRTQLQRIAALDSSWAHLGNGLNAHNNPAWLSLYLSVCKLLDLCLALPADQVPQFQLYRWAFVGTVEADCDESEVKDKRHKSTPCFTPHIVRLAKLLNSRLQNGQPVLKQIPGRPLLTFPVLRSLVELQAFFNTYSYSQAEKAFMTGGDTRKITKSKSTPVGMATAASSALSLDIVQPSKSNRQFIEELVKQDFLEFLAH
ncbi:protein dopey-1-like isoform X2 [Gigantopelta aegis]|uniref:protein dopey-1-like isoform X2 n=1 Tax=Gigantopelta aegis TaxID=1735272 RepID=UPI001B88C826|nr:protein dopey-1-like isoform X2 [Gigantopelta aegis]